MRYVATLALEAAHVASTAQPAVSAAYFRAVGVAARSVAMGVWLGGKSERRRRFPG